LKERKELVPMVEQSYFSLSLGRSNSSYPSLRSNILLLHCYKLESDDAYENMLEVLSLLVFFLIVKNYSLGTGLNYIGVVLPDDSIMLFFILTYFSIIILLVS